MLQRLRASERCVVLLDYDGTLTPLVTDPTAAHLSPAMRQVLASLVHHPRYQVAIVSGRTLPDLRTRVTGLTRYLAGNHGLEMAGPGLVYCHPEAAQLQPQVQALAESLQHALATIPGAWVEDICGADDTIPGRVKRTSLAEWRVMEHEKHHQAFPV